MPAINLFTGEKQPTTDDPYASGTPVPAATYPPDEIPLYQDTAPASTVPAPTASEPYATATPLGSITPSSAQPVASAQSPWWEQARSALGELIHPGPNTPAPEPRDPYTKPETPPAESLGFLPSTAADWEMQRPDGSWAPYPGDYWDLPDAFLTGGKVLESKWGWDDGQQGWQDPVILRYDPGTTWRIAPTNIVNGTTQVYDPVTVRRRDGASGPGVAPASATTNAVTPEWYPGTDVQTRPPEPAGSDPNAQRPVTSPAGSGDSRANAVQEEREALDSNWHDYLMNTSGPDAAASRTESAPATPAPVGRTPAAQTTQSSQNTQNTQNTPTTQTITTSDPRGGSTPPSATAPSQSGRTHPGTQNARQPQDASAIPPRPWGRYFAEGENARDSDDDPWNSPIYARYFAALNRRYGSERAKQVIRQMARNDRHGATSRRPRAANLVPGENGFLEHLTRR